MFVNKRRTQLCITLVESDTEERARHKHSLRLKTVITLVNNKSGNARIQQFGLVRNL